MEGRDFSKQISDLKTSIQRVRSHVTEELDNLSATLDKLSEDIGEDQKWNKENERQKKVVHLRKASDSPTELPERVFLHRNSLIVDMMEIEHIQTVYNLSAAFLFLIAIIVIISYSLETDRLMDDLRLVQVNCGKFSTVISLWMYMNLSIVCLLYTGLHLWANKRQTSRHRGLIDGVFLCAYILYLTGFIVVPAKIVFKQNLPSISSVIVAMEQSRLWMKAYAFARENIKKVLTKKDSEEKPVKIPDLGKLVYFLFAPTLVYRDNYPRTPSVRWHMVMWYFGQFAACVFLYSVAFNRFIRDLFSKAGKDDFQLLSFTLTTSSVVILGCISMFLVFYGFLHCWLNTFAEMLRFGDRLFYLDWWNSTDYSAFYRKWNMVVHDWIFAYVYRDIYKLLHRNKRVAMVSTLIFSALAHEYILAVTFHFFFPMLFAFFGTLGIYVVFLTKQKTSSFWNVFIWMSLFAGWGMLIVFYTIEYYARINCPQTLDNLTDFFVPRSVTPQCNAYRVSIWFPTPLP